MSETRTQTLANHNRIDPWFHYAIGPILIICFAFAVYLAIRRTNALHLWMTVLSLAAVLLAYRCRVYALKVQDRVIRLEERLRLFALLPEAWRPRVAELTERQLIALRFAPDEELPSLVEKTLRENLDPKAIKKAIQQWRPDYWRV